MLRQAKEEHDTLGLKTNLHLKANVGKRTNWKENFPQKCHSRGIDILVDI